MSNDVKCARQPRLQPQVRTLVDGEREQVHLKLPQILENAHVRCADFNDAMWIADGISLLRDELCEQSNGTRYDGSAMATEASFHGKWALVTGASSGIGTALARELASRSAKLILTARRRERLEALAAELGAKGAEASIIVADLNHPAAPQQIYDATEGAGVAVDILVNNAGLGQYGAFHLTHAEQELSQVRVNCEAVVRLSRLFVPRMVERRRGWVLVVASTASFQPVPYLTTYAATKAFDRFFALGLAAEVARFGVNVTALCPGTTESEFFEVAHASAFRNRDLQSAEDVARLAIDALARGQRTIVPKGSGKFTAFLVRFLPVGLITRFVEKAARPPAEGPPSQ